MYVGKERDYQSESDADALHSAHQVRSDGKRHAKAMKMLKSKAKGSDSYGACYKHESMMLDDQSGHIEPSDGDPQVEQSKSPAASRAEGK